MSVCNHVLDSILILKHTKLSYVSHQHYNQISIFLMIRIIYNSVHPTF